MKHCVKKMLSLAFALALCLAVGGTALAETPEQEVLAYEQNVTAEPGTTTIDKLATEGYQVTIPTTVTVDSTTAKGKLMVTARLKQYRTLNITMKPQDDKWTLKYQDAAADANTPQVGYSLKSEAGEGHTSQNMVWRYDERKHEINYVVTGVTSIDTANIPLLVNVTDPSQATMSGTYSDTVSFEFDLTKQCVTYIINVYGQELKLTNSGTHVQAVDVVDANGNVIGNPTPKLTQTFEYPLQNEDHPWTYSSDDPEDDKLRWKELPGVTMNAFKDNEKGRTSVTFNLNLKRKWYWLDVNGITNKDTCADCEKSGNQGGRIASFVNIKVSVDGTNWSDWFWYSDGDDYWGTFPYGTEFQLGLHRVKDGYAYDEENGEVVIYANGTPAYTQDTDVSPDKKTNYRVYKGKLEGEPVDKTLHDTKWGGNSHAAGSYPRYCYNVCFVDGITYYANGGTGGREDTNLYHGAHTTFKYTAGMTLADPLNDELTGCKFTAPAGKEFAGWSTTKDYTGQTLYAPGDSVSSVEWPTRPGTSNHDTLPTGDSQTVCRTLYAIWKKPYTVKVQFGGIIGWTDWDAATQSFSKQGGDGFNEPAVELGKAYAYGNTSLTLSKTENADVWNALQTKITEKTRDIAGVARPDAVWQLKDDEYTTTRLTANGEAIIQIKRKRYLLNVIPALKNDDGYFTPVSNATDAEQYGTFRLKSCGAEQTKGGKVSYYQHMRNYGGSYQIYEVEPTPGYLFVGFRVIHNHNPADKSGPSYSENLTGKNSGISYFKDGINTYEGDTIYVMYEKDTRNQITFDYNGGITVTDGATKLVSSYDETIRFPKVVLTHQPNNNLTHIGWSTEKNPAPGDEIFKLASYDQVNGVNPDITTVSSKVKKWPNENKKVLYAVWSSNTSSTTPATGPSLAPAAKKVLTVRYHANFDPMEELALDLDPAPLLEDMDDDFGFEPDPLPEDVLDPLEEQVKTVTYKPDEDVVLRHCMFKRGGYVFVGWNTEPDGTGKKYDVNGVPIPDWAAGATVDLYAQWRKPDHQRPVWDDDTQPGGTTPAPIPQPEEPDDAFGIDPQLGGMDDAFGV